MIFDNIYESGFLPALRSLDLNGTFVWANGGGGDSPYAMLSRHCLVGIVWVTPSTTLSDRGKIRGPLASLLFLNLYTTASTPLTCEPVPSLLQFH